MLALNSTVSPVSYRLIKTKRVNRAITAKQLIAPQHIATLRQYYTITRVTGRVDTMTATNIDTAAHTLTVPIVPSAGSASTGNKIISAKSIACTGETLRMLWMLGQNIRRVIRSGAG